MASPLLEFANARVRILASNSVERDINGRIFTNDNAYYIVVCYMKRSQYSGVTSGSRKIPLSSELNGEMLPGASGDEFYYRGYALEYAQILSNYDWKKQDISDLVFTDTDGTEDFLRPQKEVEFLFGSELMRGIIQRSSGTFGGVGIDEIIYPSIGVELQLTGSQVLN